AIRCRFRVVCRKTQGEGAHRVGFAVKFAPKRRGFEEGRSLLICSIAVSQPFRRRRSSMLKNAGIGVWLTLSLVGCRGELGPSLGLELRDLPPPPPSSTIDDAPTVDEPQGEP